MIDTRHAPLISCCRCGHFVEPAIQEYFEELIASSESLKHTDLLTPCCANCIDVLFGLADKNKVLN